MDFVFFYGTIPTAPSVYVFACQYGVQPDVIATSVVFCLLCAAPLMFVTNVLIEQDLLSMMEQHSSDIPQGKLHNRLTWKIPAFGVCRPVE